MKIFLVIALIIVLFIVFCVYQNNKIDTDYYSIDSKKSFISFKIAHLSDFHSKPFKSVLKSLEKEKPDIICITGDFINDHARRKEKMLCYAKELVKIAPVYYITGNHERRLDNFSEVMRELKKAGFNVLLNETVKTDFGAILGLDENQADFDDYRARKNGTFEYKDMSPHFKQLDSYNGFKIVLSHFPENFEGIKELNYSQYDFDLQLSGHAHGGQWIFPFIGPLFSPGQGIFPKYARGSFGERPKLIVSRGLGNSEFPLRLFNHPQIIFVTINNK